MLSARRSFISSPTQLPNWLCSCGWEIFSRIICRRIFSRCSSKYRRSQSELHTQARRNAVRLCMQFRLVLFLTHVAHVLIDVKMMKLLHRTSRVNDEECYVSS